MVNKLSYFQSFVYASKFSIFCLSETWLSSHIYDSEIFPSNFVVYRKDRPSRGGGVLIAINSLFHSSLLHSPPHLGVIDLLG